jgi:hypothetical protein
MPAIDYRRAQTQLRLAEVLELIGYRPRSRHGPQWRGPCPLHGSRSATSRAFAAHLGKNLFHCFRCGAGGNALDLWAALTRPAAARGGTRLVPTAASTRAMAGPGEADQQALPWKTEPVARGESTDARTLRELRRPYRGATPPNGGTPGTSATKGAARTRSLGTLIPQRTHAPRFPTSSL